MWLRAAFFAAGLLSAGGAAAEDLAPGYVIAPAPPEARGKQTTEASGLVFTDSKGWYRLTYGTDGRFQDDGKSTSFIVTNDQGAEVQFNFIRSPFSTPVADMSFDQIQATQPRQFDPRSDMEKQLTDQQIRDRHILMLSPPAAGAPAPKPVRVAVWVMPQPDATIAWLGIAASPKGFLIINAVGPNVQAIETYLKSHLQVAEGFVR